MSSGEEKLAEIQAGTAKGLKELERLSTRLSGLADEEAKAKKLEKLNSWRYLWGAFMIMIALPAWLLAGTVEGESFGHAVEYVSFALREWLYVPGILAAGLSWPITVLAKIFPASSTWPFLMVLVLGAGFAIIPLIFFAIFFGHRFRPYFRKMKSKIDPDWEAKENQHVVKHAAIRSGPFSTLVIFICVSSCIGMFFLLPNIRALIADRWVGDLYIVESTGKRHKLDARIDLNYIDPGYIADLRPGIKDRSLFLEFSGNDLALLQKLGISDQFFKGTKHESLYSQGRCVVSGGGVLSQGYSFELRDEDSPYEEKKSQKCPKVIRMDISSFGTAKLSIALASDKYLLQSNLSRDSRWSFIEQYIVSKDYQKSPSELIHRHMAKM